MKKIKQISLNFSIDEFLYSQTAIASGLDNTPDAVATANIRRLVERLLQPLRDRLGEPIAILSGYRSDELNRLVGGVPSSQHRLGEAADCYCAAGPDHLLKVLKASGLPFDQAIIYCRRQFLHLSYREGRNRGMVIYK